MKKRWIGAMVLVLVGAGLYFSLPLITPHRTLPPPAEVTELDSSEFFIPEPTVVYGFVVDSLEVVEDYIRPNQSLAHLLLPFNISTAVVHEIAQISREVFDVRKIAANKKYVVLCERDSLRTPLAMIYESNALEYIVFHFKDSLAVQRVERELEVVEKEVAGTIELSLSVSMAQLGISPQLTNDFVDVFGWQIDFLRLQKGDKFKVIFEEKQVEGKPVGLGKIKAIYFEHFGNTYYAIPFDQGNGMDYFDADGKNLRKAFLRYPIQFTRISSRYSGARFHPVQKVWKPHLGTDFAAPKGTPIRTVGDGIVLEASYSSGNGNYVKVRHNATYTTQYLHMSKIESGIKPGQKVKQGQVIGYVGSTGLATGDHLCFRFWKNGVQVDALKVELPPAEPLREEYKASFEEKKRQLLTRLSAIKLPDEKNNQMATSENLEATYTPTGQ
jgi:murein DD-endopeptidase MepM/ murein hydrolase activator NlpD